jgi:xanthine/CO dehydrogenase XdhC/CoxF family maturation factor
MVFRQTILPPVALVVFGAGDDAQPLVRFATALGWQVTVVDPRSALATPERFPEADTTVIARPEELPARVVLGVDSLAVIMTHHYRHDLPLLRTLLPRPLAYLGLLGPRKRAEKIISDLAADGFAVTPEMRARLHAPVGLDLGAESPAEVALAILAEMQAVLSGRDSRPLRNRDLPIHG